MRRLLCRTISKLIRRRTDDGAHDQEEILFCRTGHPGIRTCAGRPLHGAAGAAAASPFNGSGSLASNRAFEAAEAQAASAGLGMWSSKGWQAKRAIDLAEGERASNVSLQTVERVADQASMVDFSFLVQDLNRSKFPSWNADDLGAVSYVMARRSKDRLWNVNASIKAHGWSRGIRDGVSDWNIVDPGINASDMPDANVSAFGSGLTRRAAERVLRRANPLRRRYFPRTLPQMNAPVFKTARRSYSDTLRLKRITASSLQTGPGRMSRGQKPTPILAMKTHARSAVQASAVSSSAYLTGPKIPGWRRSKFHGAVYSAQSAAGRRGRPLNEYRAVRGPGFSASWQDAAWHAAPDSAGSQKT